MLTNRSAPHARVTPVLTVTDVRAAVAWYQDVFGFVEHVRIGEGHRSQLGLPDGPAAELVLSEVWPGRSAPDRDTAHEVMLKVADVEAVVERAESQGATVVDPVHDWEYGERQAAVLDPFGHRWVLNQTLTDVRPEDWGGQTVTPRSSRRPGGMNGPGRTLGPAMDNEVRDALHHSQTIDLTTTGRRTGHPRRIEIFLHDKDGDLFITGMPRADRTRDWIHNIKADPNVTIHLKQSVNADVAATARVISDPVERRPLIEDAAKRWGRTDVETMLKHSPLIVLRVEGDSATGPTSS